MAQASTPGTKSGRRARRTMQSLARRAGFSPAKKVGIAGVVLVVLIVVIACTRVAFGSQGGSFSVERGESAVAADSAPSEMAAQDERTDSASDTVPQEPPTVVIHVDGMVANPGVYRLVGESLRVQDAVTAAGGLAEGADTSMLNLAATVSDGEKIHVPAIGEENPASGGAAASSSGEVPPGGSEATPSGIVNINTATAAELTALPGVGEATAAEIVRDREANGAFTSVEDLMRVSGIGEKKFAKLKEKIRV
ncbi:competence protein ComEA [Olsenella sp. KH3B4]|uniref:helix-hairpin-helix domain-containing protein n=1 Tax=Olsenella sp. KH3B4 TaxID=1855394 RepID=UPI0008BBACF7|nr:helix-hairpin-helix domain-containing protein [Olsenella sp. KH3B4]SET22677.1 competence protein ComEA [Olsenella sp. KH3B4]